MAFVFDSVRKVISRVQMLALLGYVSRRAYRATSFELCVGIVSVAFMEALLAAVPRLDFGGVHKFA